MASKINRKIAIRNSRNIGALWRRHTFLFRNLYRLLRRRYRAFQKRDAVIGQFSVKKPSSSVGSLDLNRWCFVTDLLRPEDWDALKSSWPSTWEFDPVKPREIRKIYDTGFRCSEGEFPPRIDRYPNLFATYQLFSSSEFANQISELCADGVKRTCYHIVSNVSWWGSSLVPHTDTFREDDLDAKFHINLIYFVDSNGTGWDSGGTAVLSDSSYDKPIFIPTNLNNSALVYRSYDLLHGFPSVKFGKFRKAITAHFRPI